MAILRVFTFGHVRLLDAVASKVLLGLAASTPVVVGIDNLALIDLGVTITEIHGYGKLGTPNSAREIGELEAACMANLLDGSGIHLIVPRARLRRLQCLENLDDGRGSQIKVSARVDRNSSLEVSAAGHHGRAHQPAAVLPVGEAIDLTEDEAVDRGPLTLATVALGDLAPRQGLGLGAARCVVGPAERPPHEEHYEQQHEFHGAHAKTGV